MGPGEEAAGVWAKPEAEAASVMLAKAMIENHLRMAREVSHENFGESHSMISQMYAVTGRQDNGNLLADAEKIPHGAWGILTDEIGRNYLLMSSLASRRLVKPSSALLI